MAVSKPMSYGGTLTAGIQDISALLPLLGTEQCEDHAGSALSDGFLFAAATPLSIFGTLGLARAGFKGAFASIVIPSWDFMGAEKLRDAGFKPSGKNLKLIMMDPANPDRHPAETRLSERSKDRNLEDNEYVQVPFDWFFLALWNLRMTFTTIAFCIANLTAYIELIYHTDNSVRISLRLIFPITRILGGFLTAVSLQILIQLRIASIIRAREGPTGYGLLVAEWPFILLTLLGSIGCMVGYIGCFSIVQGYAGSLRGPLIWVAAEASLSLIRILIWSLNPTWDDAPHLRLVRVGSERFFSSRGEPFVTQPLSNVEINRLDIKVQRANQFLQSLRHHSGISVQPLAFPDSSLLYSSPGSSEGLYIVIVDQVDRTARIYSEENGVPQFRWGTFTVSNVEAGPELYGNQVRVASAVVGQRIPDRLEDYVASNQNLRAALQEHYHSILRASAGNISMETGGRRDTVPLSPERRPIPDPAVDHVAPTIGTLPSAALRILNYSISYSISVLKVLITIVRFFISKPNPRDTIHLNWEFTSRLVGIGKAPRRRVR